MATSRKHGTLNKLSFRPALPGGETLGFLVDCKSVERCTVLREIRGRADDGTYTWGYPGLYSTHT